MDLIFKQEVDDETFEILKKEKVSQFNWRVFGLNLDNMSFSFDGRKFDKLDLLNRDEKFLFLLLRCKKLSFLFVNKLGVLLKYKFNNIVVINNSNGVTDEFGKTSISFDGMSYSGESYGDYEFLYPKSNELKRVDINMDDVDSAIKGLYTNLQSRFLKHGVGAFSTQHEILGVLMEEMKELTDAMHSNDKESIEKELLDIICPALLGYVCVKNNLIIIK